MLTGNGNRTVTHQLGPLTWVVETGLNLHIIYNVVHFHGMLVHVDAACLRQVITTQRELTRTDEENRALMDLALRGLHLLSSWNVRIMELVRVVCRPSAGDSDSASNYGSQVIVIIIRRKILYYNVDKCYN